VLLLTVLSVVVEQEALIKSIRNMEIRGFKILQPTLDVFVQVWYSGNISPNKCLAKDTADND
jgi:hypothetical protein